MQRCSISGDVIDSRQVSKKSGIQIRCFESPIYDRVKIKRAVTTGGVPAEFVNDFKSLWNNIERFINE